MGKKSKIILCITVLLVLALSIAFGEQLRPSILL